MAVRLDQFFLPVELRDPGEIQVHKVVILVDLYSKLVILFSGGYSGGATPLPIPNRAVKPSCADGTAGVAQWESRTLPDFLSVLDEYSRTGFCLYPEIRPYMIKMRLT